jgi:hypothetical protein
MSTAEQTRRFSRNEFERLTQENTQDERRLTRLAMENALSDSRISCDDENQSFQSTDNPSSTSLTDSVSGDSD